MVIDFRSHRYRGGSGWITGGIIAVYVGVVAPASVSISGDEVTTEPAVFARTITATDAAFSRTMTSVNAEFARTVTTQDTER